jgi:hypothetical protein
MDTARSKWGAVVALRPPRGLKQLEAVPGEDSLRVGR